MAELACKLAEAKEAEKREVEQQREQEWLKQERKEHKWLMLTNMNFIEHLFKFYQ